MSKCNERPIKPCALCRETRELEKSHIIPKFVFRHLRKTAHGAIRSTENPNMVIQDSEKYFLLCGECEDLFSSKETKFANKMFYPYQKNNAKKFEYDEDLYYFIISVSWRSLYLDIIDFVENSDEIGINSDTLNCFIEKEKAMRMYLLGDIETVEGVENHIFFFDDIKEFNNRPENAKPHSTFQRGEISYTFFSETEGTLATLTNMMGIVLFTLYKKGSSEIWVNTEIINGNGEIVAEKQGVQSVCSNELIDIMSRAKSSLNQKQSAKVIRKITDDLEGFIKSESFKAIQKDKSI